MSSLKTLITYFLLLFIYNLSFHFLVLTHFQNLHRKSKPQAGELAELGKCLPQPYEHPGNYIKSQVRIQAYVILQLMGARGKGSWIKLARLTSINSKLQDQQKTPFPHVNWKASKEGAPWLPHLHTLTCMQTCTPQTHIKRQTIPQLEYHLSTH